MTRITEEQLAEWDYAADGWANEDLEGPVKLLIAEVRRLRAEVERMRDIRVSGSLKLRDLMDDPQYEGTL